MLFRWPKSCSPRVAITAEKWTSWSAPCTKWRQRRSRSTQLNCTWHWGAVTRKRATWQHCARGRALSCCSGSPKPKTKWPTPPTSGIYIHLDSLRLFGIVWDLLGSLEIVWEDLKDFKVRGALIWICSHFWGISEGFSGDFYIFMDLRLISRKDGSDGWFTRRIPAVMMMRHGRKIIFRRNNSNNNNINNPQKKTKPSIKVRRFPQRIPRRHLLFVKISFKCFTRFELSSNVLRQCQRFSKFLWVWVSLG